MLCAEMYEEAQTELCNLGGVCARAYTGHIFQVTRQLSRLRNRRPTQLVEHYLHWLRQDGTAIAAATRPSTVLVDSCAA